MRRLPHPAPILLFALFSFVLLPSVVGAQPQDFRVDVISGGAETSRLGPRVEDYSELHGSPTGGLTDLAFFAPGVTFLAYNFDDNATLTGFIFIPPDPCGAAGTDRVIAVVNVGIEARTKGGVLLYRDSLKNFFSPLGAQTLGTFCFDPKIVYDHYENRFVVVALERLEIAAGDPSDASRILVAVSKTATPATTTAADWWYLAINSNTNIGGTNHWADYPGFEVDEEAVYITNSMFSYGARVFGGVRLWIINKGVVGGFYGGGAAGWAIHNPIPSGFFDLTTMPALVFGTGGVGGVGSSIGTYLVGYSSLTSGGAGGTEWAQIIRVDNPIGATTFTGQFVQVGDLEDVGGAFGFPPLPDAPQLGTASLIEVNDSRALDAVWRNNSLWFTTTINPNVGYDATNAGEATAHWFRFNTTVPATITLADQGNIGGEDIATDTWTFFPSVAVNKNDAAKFGFSASAAPIYCGAYYAGRESGDAAGTVQASVTVQAGLDFYLRTFGAGRNRWGDYTGAAVDPSDDTTFWIFNQYAEVRGTGTPPEDGRWGTAWASCLQVTPTDFGDAPDPSYQTLLATNGARHTIVAGIFMGALIDSEPDGLPHPAALGDDLTNLPDEDGVTVMTLLSPGAAAQIDVIASVNGWIDLWIDFDLDGAFTPADLIFSGPAAPGLNGILFTVPAYAVPGVPTFMRVRFNTAGPLPPTGPASDGEVEDYEVWVEEPEPQEDFGDAPDPTYRTLLANNGARHTIVPGVFMGVLIDAEPDGQPHPSAFGDDVANLPDEDGVVVVTTLAPGMPAQIDVTVSVAGWLDLWIDFDMDGTFSPIDLVFSGPVGPGLNPIFFNVPVYAPPGAVTFMRVRFNTGGPLLADGPAQDGEVEDYEVFVEDVIDVDFGDAPDPTYPTILLSDGARHSIIPGVFMGNLIDSEGDGQPHPNALGDDLANLDDEDGVTFVTLLTPGAVAQIDVVVSAGGWLDAWIDFNQNGAWEHPGELVYSGGVAAGNNPLFVPVPSGIALGQTFARFRYNINGVTLSPTGYSPDGEVEDYEVAIEEPEPTEDFGDAPDPTYQTLLATNGARHTVVPGVFMGLLIDAELDGQPNLTATGDDLANLPDEDGVTFITPVVPGQAAQIDVVVSLPGWVDIWIDLDLDGLFTPADQVFSGPVNPGLNSIPYNVPGLSTPGASFARIRYNTGGPLPADGPAPDGEVEDYKVVIEEPPLDFGDAPDTPYPTLLASNGARHVIVPGVFMGALIDAEVNGQPTAAADGDDLNNLADEDGLVFVTPLTVGGNPLINVTVSLNGWLDLWVDYDQNGSWSAGELVYSGAVSAGINNIMFTIPAGVPSGTTFLRARYNLVGAQPVTGLAGDGEVEDYEIQIQTVTGLPDEINHRFHMNPATPNPFLHQTTVSYTIPTEQRVVVQVFTMDGRLAATLVNEQLPPGLYQAEWSGLNDRGQFMPSGVYFFRIQAGDKTQTQRAVFIR